MKFKYFLRGLGTGIIFASLICVVAFQTSGSEKISDKEVIELAKQLGMVEKQDSVKDMFGTSTSEKKESTESQTVETTTEEVAATEEVATTEESTTEVATTEESTTEKTTEQMTEVTTTEKTADATTEETSPKTVTITIGGGMTSYPVCERLQELGVIEDAADFDDYLVKNGYANRISVGTHTLTIGMTYEEIAIAISDPR